MARTFSGDRTAGRSHPAGPTESALPVDEDGHLSLAERAGEFPRLERLAASL